MPTNTSQPIRMGLANRHMLNSLKGRMGKVRNAVIAHVATHTVVPQPAPIPVTPNPGPVATSGALAGAAVVQPAPAPKEGA